MFSYFEFYKERFYLQWNIKCYMHSVSFQQRVFVWVDFLIDEYGRSDHCWLCNIFCNVLFINKGSIKLCVSYLLGAGIWHFCHVCHFFFYLYTKFRCHVWLISCQSSCINNKNSGISCIQMRSCGWSESPALLNLFPWNDPHCKTAVIHS